MRGVCGLLFAQNHGMGVNELCLGAGLAETVEAVNVHGDVVKVEDGQMLQIIRVVDETFQLRRAAGGLGLLVGDFHGLPVSVDGDGVGNVFVGVLGLVCLDFRIRCAGHIYVEVEIDADGNAYRRNHQKNGEFTLHLGYTS